MTNLISEITPIGVSWVIYFVIHSILASLSVKQWIFTRWPRIEPYYRLLYNILSLVFFIPVYWVTQTSHTPMLLTWNTHVLQFFMLIHIAVFLLFVWTLRYYDMREFSGLHTIRPTRNPDSTLSSFCISPLHRIVRHPWYFLILLFIWTKNGSVAWFISNCLISLYLIIGSRLEEKKLIIEFGDVYRFYQSKVPGLLPLPGKYLTKMDLISINSKNPRL